MQTESTTASGTDTGTPGGTVVPWAAFVLGAGTSIAANVAHAADRAASGGTGAMLFAAWAPVALLLVAEMVTRGKRRHGVFAAAQWTGTAVVAVVAAVVSFGHMRDLLLSYGESELVAYLLPLSVDGLVVVASAALAAPGKRAAHVPEGAAHGTPVPATVADVPETVAAAVPHVPEETATVPDVVPHSVPLPEPRAVSDKRAVPETANGTDGQDVVPDLRAATDERHTAREYVRAAIRDGRKVTGKDVAGEFGKSERWGRSRIAEVKAASHADA